MTDLIFLLSYACEVSVMCCFLPTFFGWCLEQYSYAVVEIVSSLSKPTKGSKKREERQREEDPKGAPYSKKMCFGTTEL